MSICVCTSSTVLYAWCDTPYLICPPLTPSSNLGDVKFGTLSSLATLCTEHLESISNLHVGLGCNLWRQGPHFRNRNCVRYRWPFCDYQLITRSVVIAPAFNGTVNLAHFDASPFSTVFEFVGSAVMHVVNVNLLGPITLNFYLKKLAIAFPFLPQVDSGHFSLDKRHTLGGNFITQDVVVRCSTQHSPLPGCASSKYCL